MSDGGVVALTGYLYQLLGTAALLADHSGDMYSFVLLEPNGEDALLRTAGENSLYQFKYSDSAADITPQGLASILKKLEAHSEPYAAKSWVLVTNRKKSVTTTAILGRLPRDAIAFARVDPKDIATIERLGSKLTWKHTEFDDAFSALKAQCQVFGLNDAEELRRGANQVVGTLIRALKEQGAGVPFTREELDASLVGIQNPGRLDGAQRCEHAAQIIESRCGVHSHKLDQIQPRRCLQGLLHSDNSVVVVEGHGGSGKTISVMRLLRDHVLSEKRLGMALLSSENDTFESTVANWRQPGVATPTPEEFERSLERLRLANQQIAGPVVLIVLDGLDEEGWDAQQRRHNARVLIRRALGRPSITTDTRQLLKIVVTCRRRSEITDLLNEEGVGGESLPTGPHFIELGDFEEEEFRALWQRWFPDTQPPKWVRAGDDSRTMRTLDDTEASNEATTELEQRVIAALRTPAILGCFRNLSGEIQRAILLGHHDAWCSLAIAQMDWFKLRVRRRRGLNDEAVSSVFQEAAKKTSGNLKGTYEYRKDWKEPAVTNTLVSSVAAQQLFVDAVTTGLIQTDQGLYKMNERIPLPWKWRFPFLPEYLCSLP